MGATRKIKGAKWKINPNIVLTFISKNPENMPSIPNYGDYTIEEDIYRVRLMLWHSKKRFDLYERMTKEQGVRSISESTLVKILGESRQKKYRERGSPAFSANDLCGSRLLGNDRKMYISKKNASGNCVWT